MLLLWICSQPARAMGWGLEPGSQHRWYVESYQERAVQTNAFDATQVGVGMILDCTAAPTFLGTRLDCVVEGGTIGFKRVDLRVGSRSLTDLELAIELSVDGQLIDVDLEGVTRAWGPDAEIAEEIVRRYLVRALVGFGLPGESGTERNPMLFQTMPHRDLNYTGTLTHAADGQMIFSGGTGRGLVGTTTLWHYQASSWARFAEGALEERRWAVVGERVGNTGDIGVTQTSSRGFRDAGEGGYILRLGDHQMPRVGGQAETALRELQAQQSATAMGYVDVSDRFFGEAGLGAHVSQDSAPAPGLSAMIGWRTERGLVVGAWGALDRSIEMDNPRIVGSAPIATRQFQALLGAETRGRAPVRFGVLGGVTWHLIQGTEPARSATPSMAVDFAVRLPLGTVYVAPWLQAPFLFDPPSVKVSGGVFDLSPASLRFGIHIGGMRPG